MTPNRSRSAAEHVLAVLDADAALIEHYNPAKIEALPIADVRARLVELELPSSMPPRLKDAIRSSVSPPAEVLSFLAEEQEALCSVEKKPLMEVTSRLRALGINYQAGAQQIRDLVQQHAPEPTPRPQKVSVSWVKKIETVANAVIAILLSFGDYHVRTTWALPQIGTRP